MVVIGIDFGNDTCVVSVCKNGKIMTVTNDFKDTTTPSMVAFSKHYHEVGEAAKKQWETNITKTIFDFKNVLDSNLKKKWKYEILTPHESLDDVALSYKFTFLYKTFELSPRQILIMLFAKIKSYVNAFIRPSVVTGCVLAAPSYFNENERNGLLIAAGIAGLDCHFLIKETTAIAINYSLKHKFQFVGNIVFIDFGYSSIQVFICKFSKKDLEVKTEVSELIGGRDIDELLADYVIKALKVPAIDKNDKVFCVQLLQEVEKLKKAMTSSTEQVELNTKLIDRLKGYSYFMNRADMDNICFSLYERIENILYLCLEQSRLKIKDIHSVELVGGSGCIPAVQKLVENVFEKTPNSTINQEDSVSRGCLLKLIISLQTRGYKVKENPIIAKCPPCTIDDKDIVRIYQVHRNLHCAFDDSLDISERQFKEYMRIQSELPKYELKEVDRRKARNELERFLNEQMTAPGILANTDSETAKYLLHLRSWEDGTIDEYQKLLAQWMKVCAGTDIRQLMEEDKRATLAQKKKQDDEIMQDMSVEQFQQTKENRKGKPDTSGQNMDSPRTKSKAKKGNDTRASRAKKKVENNMCCPS